MHRLFRHVPRSMGEVSCKLLPQRSQLPICELFVRLEGYFVDHGRMGGKQLAANSGTVISRSPPQVYAGLLMQPPRQRQADSLALDLPAP